MFGQSDRSMAFNSSARAQVKIFPNPFSNYLKIDDRAQTVKRIEVYNLLGKKVSSFEVLTAGASYSVENLPNGFYLVRIINDRNKVIRTQRLQKR